MMKSELKEKFEELGKAILCLEDGEILGIHYDRYTKLLEVHVVDEKFPFHQTFEVKYVWRDSKEYPWQKQVTINGVTYFDCITREQFDREHAKEEDTNV